MRIVKKGEIREVEILDLAYGGKGIGKINGLVVMVWGGLPGDKLKVKITQRKKNFSFAEILEIIKPSELRLEPLCSHFAECGGCIWQNLKYEDQLKFKQRQVEESLKRIGGFEELPIEPILGSEDIFFYRNKMEYSFGNNLRGELILGLHKRESYLEIFDLKKCYLLSEISNQIVSLLKELFRNKNLPPYHIKEHTGFLRFLTIREGKNTGERMVNLITAPGDFSFKEEFYSLLAKNFPQIKAVLWSINSKRANIAIGEKEFPLSKERTITEKLGKFIFEISANSFFQTNSQQAEKLYEKVLKLAELKGDEEVLDLYCGTGTISLFLAQTCKKVIGVETVPDSIKDASRNQEINKIKNCEFLLAEAKDVLHQYVLEKKIFNVVVLDPPRAGVHPKVLENLLKLKPPKIVYVSCNPTTLARDLKFFCGKKYNLEKVLPVDMFPQTHHIETMVQLKIKE